MNKKISQFNLTQEFHDGDVLTLVQDKQNKIISKEVFEAKLGENFATNDKVNNVTNDLNDVKDIVSSNYSDLSKKITAGDNAVRKEYKAADSTNFEALDNKLNLAKDKHDKDINDIKNTVQDWADTIDEKALKEQVQIILNRLTVDENLITELANIIAQMGGSGGSGGGGIPGAHTQPTSTIFPLTGYVKGNNADPLTTTDTLNQALSKLENQIANGTGSGSMLPLIKKGETTATSDGTLYTSAKVEEDYIRKVNGIATALRIERYMQNNGEFTSGFAGKGFQLKENDGKWRMELDELFVRGAMTVSELVLNEIKAVGGDIIVSMADMEISKVEDEETAYKCFMDDHDGTKHNEFLVNDLAICQQFDGKNVRRYWRRVIEVGTGVGNTYVKLSKTDCEPNSGEPMVGDKLLLLGHKFEADPQTNKKMADRRAAIFITSKGEGAPRITFYENIDDFTLVNKDRTSIGKDSKFVGTISQTTETGDIVRVPVYRGVWVSGNTYNYYDQVTYQGQLWICMRDGVTTAPAEGEDWQLQVAKGDKGQSGDDAAKWVEITGNRLFLYNTTDFSDTPTPESIVLTANTYGIEEPTYKWLLNGERVSTEQTCTILHSAFITRTVTIRCTITDKFNNEYYDETQLAKLSSGADGEDAYYVDLTNGTVNIPYNDSGNLPLIDITSVYTEVYAYKGIEAIGITLITPSVVSGDATVTVSGNKVNVKTLNSTSATIRLAITLADSTIINKDWYVNKTANGKDGFSGVDASYVVVTGSMIFKYSKNTLIPDNTTIELTASQYQIESPVYTWYYYNIATGKWDKLTTGYQTAEDNSYSVLTIGYNTAPYFNDLNVNIARFKVECTSSNGGNIYFDEISIIKQYDGKDGLAGYGCILTNENITVPATYLGNVTGNLSNYYTNTELWYGTEKINSNDYTISCITLTGTGNVNVDNVNKKITLSSFPAAEDYNVFRVSFKTNVVQLDGSSQLMEVGTRDFTVSKAKGAAKQDAQVTIYAEALNTARPNAPGFVTDPPVASGSLSNGTIWYPDADSSHFSYGDNEVIWASQSTLSGTTNKFGDWSTPTQWSGQGAAGKDGATPEIRYIGGIGYWYINGVQIGQATGDDGIDGVNGVDGKSPYISNGYWYYWNGTSWIKSIPAQGEKGAMGPGFNFRGEYDINKTYYYTENQRDVVFENNKYYMVASLGTVKDQRPGSSNKWTTFGGSFESLATNLFLANEATIAGWVFSKDRIRSASSNFLLDGRASANYPIAIGSNAVSSPSNANFYVDSTGKLSAKGAFLEGDLSLTGNSGSGKFYISEGYPRLWIFTNDNKAFASLGPTISQFKTQSSEVTIAADSTQVSAPLALSMLYYKGYNYNRAYKVCVDKNTNLYQYLQANASLTFDSSISHIKSTVGGNSAFIDIGGNTNGGVNKIRIEDSTTFIGVRFLNSSGGLLASVYWNSNGLNLQSSKWPSYGAVETGFVYLDSNTKTLKVK